MGASEDVLRLARGLDRVLRDGGTSASTLEAALDVVIEALDGEAAALWPVSGSGTQRSPCTRGDVALGDGVGALFDGEPALGADGTARRAPGVVLAPAAVGGERLGHLVLRGRAGRAPSSASAVVAAGLIAALLRLHEAEERFAAMTGSSIDALVTADAAGCIATFNERAEAMFGWSEAEVVGRSLTLLMPERFHAAHEGALHRVSAGGPARALGQVLELTARRRSGEEFPVELVLGAWSVGTERRYTGSFRDVSERVRVAERIERLVYFHPQTGLPNEADLRRRLATARPVGAVVAVGIGRLDVVVEEVGSAAGDATVREAARRLAAMVPAGGSVHHHGADVLLAYLPAAGSADLAQVGRSCLEAISHAPVVSGEEIWLEPAVGLATVPPGDPAQAIKHALRALGVARDDGPGAVRCFGEVVAGRRATLSLERELRRGIGRGELVLHYQPVVVLAAGRTRAVEALVRWQHPTQGLLAPAAFIDVAERTALIDELGGWVVEESCRQLAGWRSAGVDLRVAFNVSPRQLRRGAVLVRLEAALRATGAPPDRLIAEVTETTAVEDLLEGRDVLTAFAGLGMGVALDDFGTGLSSLGRLAELPADSLKLDRSLISGLPDGRAAQALVRAAVQLGRGLGLKIVAEGVERPEQLRWLRDVGCDLAQGYLLSRPVPAAAVPDALDAVERLCIADAADAARVPAGPHPQRVARPRTRRRHGGR